MSDKEVLKGLKNSKPYDFIANNYLSMSKLQLKDIILELLINFNITHKDTTDELIEDLVEYRSWEE